MPEKVKRDYINEIQDLQLRLKEAQDTLEAIVREEVDALVVKTPQGPQIYSLKGAEKPYRILVEEMKEGAVMLSGDDTILYSNESFAKMVKYPLEKVTGLNIENMISPPFKESFLDLLAQCRGGLKNAVTTKGITLIASDKSLVPTQISVNSLKMEKTTTTFIVATDLTEHMEEEVKRYTTDLEKAGVALFESEQRWSTTLASIGDAVIATDVDGKITFMNAVAEDLTGWSLSEASQKHVSQVFNIICEDTRLKVDDPVRKVLKKGLVIGLANHTILLRKDGTEIPIDDSGAPIRAKDGRVTGVVLIFRDIRVRKELEKKLETYTKNLEGLVKEGTKKLNDAERMAAIGQTAAMVGHDIRNPLQSIESDVYLVKSDLHIVPEGEEKENMKESLSGIEKNVDYINKIVQDLQDFVKPLKPTVQEIEIEELIQEVLFKNGIPENIHASCKVDEKANKIIGDPAFLKRILNNLVSNAIQAMPRGGKLEIVACRNEGEIVITVKDTGVGIAEKDKPMLFTPLFTTKSKGQGFGLAVVKRMTESLGGTVMFESQEGKGTTFILRFPPQTAKW
jgi:PAS domain S-box-containing protein